MGGITPGQHEDTDGITRRQVLKRGAVVGGAALWVTPVVQVLAVSESSAQQPSGAGPGNEAGNANPRGPAKGRPFR